jgi:hypothetical protein
VDVLIVASHHAGASADVNFPKSDLTSRIPSVRFTQCPPKNFANAITWLQETFELTFTQAAAGGLAEYAIQFAIGSLPGASKIASLYDQYALYSAHVRIIPERGTAGTPTANPPGSPGQLITAIDYDNTSSLGSWTAYQQFNTAVEVDATYTKSFERYVKPVVMTVTGASNSTTNTGVGLSRMWINSAYPNTPHFGLRIAAQGNTTGLTVIYRMIVTQVMGLRNAQ